MRPINSAEGRGRGSHFFNGGKGSVHTHKISESISIRCQSGDLTKLMRESSGGLKRSEFNRGGGVMQSRVVPGIMMRPRVGG
jgi:hypothetical protein